MKTFSGKFVLRIPLELHKKLANLGSAKKLSLNQLCVMLINKGIEAPDAKNHSEFEPVVKKLKAKFGDQLTGVVLFGSQATGEATASSDTDLLIILNASAEISRKLYSWWDSEISWSDGELNPHFVCESSDLSDVSGLWFEVALTGEIVYQKGSSIEKIFVELKKYIADGNVRRYISNGHPYWVRRNTGEEQNAGS